MRYQEVIHHGRGGWALEWTTQGGGRIPTPGSLNEFDCMCNGRNVKPRKNIIKLCTENHKSLTKFVYKGRRKGKKAGYI